MSDETGRRDLFRRVLGRRREPAGRPEAPAPREPSVPREPVVSWQRGVAPVDEEQVAAALAQLRAGKAATSDSTTMEPRRPSYLDEMLGRGHAEPEDARGPGSQRGRRLPVLPIVRPPGAVAEALFVEACDACGACMEACPHDAIRPLDGRHGPVEGTPTIRGLESPCLMCADFPCVTACDRGALVHDAPRRIGVAEIRQYDCLAWSGSFCSTCVERCPEPGAIETTHGKPRIVEDACTGCGICQNVCPAPRNAILIVAPAARLEEQR